MNKVQLAYNTAPRRLLTDSDPIGSRIYSTPHGRLAGRLIYAWGDFAWVMWDSRDIPSTTYLDDLWTDGELPPSKTK